MALKWDSKRTPAAKFVKMAERLAESMQSMDTRQDSIDVLDANETLVFARQLEYIYAQTYDIKYPELKARQYIPPGASVPNGADTYTYRAFDQAGIAKMIADYSEDLPDVSAMGKEWTGFCRSMGAAYSYSLQDVRRASMANMPLEATLARNARRAIERLHDDVAAFGDSKRGLVGFLNQANVPLVTPITGNWDTLGTTTTPLQVIADLNKLTNSVFTSSIEIHTPDTLLLDTVTFALLSTTPMSTTTTITDDTILSFFLKKTPFIKQVGSWNKLAKADAGGTKPRAMVYQRSSENMELIIPQEFEQLPPQPRGLSWQVPCHSRTGGVKWTYPFAAAYMDGIHS